MAQWWHGSVHHPFLHHRAFHVLHAWSSIAVRSFILSSPLEDATFPKITPSLGNPDKSVHTGSLIPSIISFCEDDPPFNEHMHTITLQTAKLEIMYSPWAISMMEGLGKSNTIGAKELTGGPTGGGKGDDDGGDHGGGGGEGDSEDWLPLLTVAFAALQLGYCIAVWMKNEALDIHFIRVGVGLFWLLVLAAVRLSNHTGVDGFVLGLGVSIAVMLWAGERCTSKKGGPSGIVTICAAAMAIQFTLTLCDNVFYWFIYTTARKELADLVATLRAPY